MSSSDTSDDDDLNFLLDDPLEGINQQSLRIGKKNKTKNNKEHFQKKGEKEKESLISRPF